MAVILKMQKNKTHHFIATVQAVAAKFGRMIRTPSLNPNGSWKFESFKIRADEMIDGRYFEN